MKTKLFTLLLAVAASVGTMFAWDYEYVQIGDLYYNLDATNQTAEVAINSSASGDIVIPSSVTYNSVSYSVTSIGSSAFGDCTGLTSVEIPNSVTTIGIGAFYKCSGLTSVTIPNSVTSIGGSAFRGCSSLTSVTIPNSVTSIGYNAFRECTGLTSVTIPNSVTSIGERAFIDCSSLTSIEIPNSVTSIGEMAFYNCTGLTSPVYNAHVFAYMPTSYSGAYTIPDGIESIAGGAFYGCTGLPYVTIPNSVTSIGYRAFYGCSGLTAIYVTCGDLERVKQLYNDNRVKYAPLKYHITGNVNIEGAGSVQLPQNECDVITAIPNYGYHFAQWSDGNTDNPRTFVLTQDTSFTAEFAINNYTIETQSSLPESGIISGGGTYEYLSQQTVTAIPNYGYHFVKWVIDDTQENAISVVQAYAIASALGAGETTTVQYTIVGYVTGTYGSYSNSYYLSDSPNVPGNFIAFKCASSVNIGQYVKVTGYLTNYKGNTPETTSGSAITPNDLSPFANPCSFTLRSNISFVAEFAKNVYTITLNNAEHGSISGDTSAEYLDEVTLTANPEYGYHFAQWSDGKTENPRTIVLTQDTTFNAEFAIDKTGTCGNDNALIWTYDAETKTLTITGNGMLNSNYTFGVEAPTQMQKIVIGNEVTSIGDSAFYGMSTINHLIIGGSVATIGNYAFAECRNFDDITCYATTVPIINETTFANVGNKQYIYLFVPEARERAYHRDTYWGEFDIQVQQAEGTIVTTNDVQVEPQDNAAIVTWPTSENAASYTIQITKDGVVFCTLIFNGNGQLTGIAFAPSRDGQAHAPAATKTANGLQFTVTGLDSGTHYALTLQAKDSQETVLASYSSNFTTTTTSDAQGIEDVQSDQVPCTKILHNGQIFILRGEKVYSIDGRKVK